MKIELFPHQIKCKNLIISNNGIGAIFADVGCGKTATSLAIYEHFKLQDPSLIALVFCPLSIIENAWKNDTEKFTDYKFHNLRDKKLLPADIYVGNYEMVLNNKLPKIIESTKAKMIILDESVRIKSEKAQTTKNLLKYKDHFKYRIELSGCPAPNSMMEYWSQMTFLKSDMLHRSFYAFRSTFFHLQRGNQVMPAGTFITRDKYKEIFGKGFKYEITSANREKILTKMSPYCIWIKKEDCLKLPAEIDQTRSVTLSDKEMQCYKDIKNHLVTVINQEMIAATTALTKLIKLREITSGFLIDYAGNNISFGNSKLNELVDTLEDLGNQQVIIWINFRHEAVRLVETIGLDKCAQVHGAVKDSLQEVMDFTSGAKQYLVANPASASEGLNLQNSCVQVFFSLSYNYSDYYQCRGRTHRTGQKNVCHYIHLLAKDTIDDDIMDVISRKANAVEIVHKYLRR